jgi:hypothetical protein
MFLIHDVVTFAEGDKKSHQLEQIWRSAPGTRVSFPEVNRALIKKGDRAAMLLIELRDETVSVGKDELRPDLMSVTEAAVFNQWVNLRGEFLTLALPLRGDENPEGVQAEWNDEELIITRGDKTEIYSVKLDQ